MFSKQRLDTTRRIERAAAHVRHCADGLPMDEAVAEFYRIAEGFGFPVCANGAWYRSGKDRFSRFFFSTWPETWVQIYAANALHTDDPVVEEAEQRMEAFRFSERRAEWMSLPQRRKVIEICEDFGWREVYAIPIHGPHAYHGLVSLAAYDVPELSALDCVALEAAARAIHQLCRKTQTEDQRPKLTERQIECLRWVAAGKSDAVIAAIIGLSEPTVHYHIEQAKRRLGLRSRIEAVAQLILDGTL